jgi:hypothetical protein
MYRSVKITDKAYREAKKLAGQMSKSGVNGRVTISNVVSEGIELARERYVRKQRFMKLAGAWEDMDTEKLVDEIYKGRSASKRPEVNL